MDRARYLAILQDSNILISDANELIEIYCREQGKKDSDIVKFIAKVNQFGLLTECMVRIKSYFMQKYGINRVEQILPTGQIKVLKYY